MSNENSPQQSSFMRGLKAFLRALARILLVVILAILLALGIFYGLPWVYRQYVAPIRQDISLLQEGQAGQEQYNQQLSDRLDGLKERLESLEIQSDTSKQLASELKTSLQQLGIRLDESSEAIGALQTTPNPEILALSDSVKELGASIEEIEARLNDIDSFNSGIETEISRLDQRINQLNEVLSAADNPATQVLRELQIVKAMEHLTRSRLFLAQNNLGIAEADILASRTILVNLQATLTENQAIALEEVIERLDSALDNLPQSPVLAAEDLEIAWQLLTQGLPEGSILQATPGVQETATLGDNQEPTRTPTPTATP